MLDPRLIAVSGVGGTPMAMAVQGFTLVVLVVTSAKGGRSRRVRSASGANEYLALLDQIRKDDEEIVLLVVAAVTDGVL